MPFRRSFAVLREMPRPFRVILAGVVVNRLATFIVPFLSVLLRKHYELSDAETGLCILAFGLGTAASILTGGSLTDRFGRRRTMAASLLGSGALAVAIPFAFEVHPAAFLALLFAYGFVGDLYRPAVHAVVADVLPPERRAQGFAALRIAINLGWAVGLALGGFVERLGPTAMFAGDGLTTLVFGVLVLAAVPETKAPRAAAPGSAAGNPGLLSLPRLWLGDRVLLAVIAASLAWAVFMVSWMTVFPLLVDETMGGSLEAYGFVQALNGLLVAMFQIAVADSIPGRRLRAGAWGMALGGAAVALVGVAPGPAAWAALMTVYTFGEMILMPPMMAFLSDWAPPERRGAYVGSGQAVFSLAFAFGPVLFLPLRRALGDATYWPLLACSAVPGVLLLLWLDRHADRPERLRGAL